MIKLDDKPIKVPNLIMQKLIQEYGETPALVMLAPSTKIINIFPTTSENVIQIVSYPSPDYVCSGDSTICGNLRQFYATEKIKLIYMTACACYLHIDHNPCEAIAYLDLPSKEFSLEAFKHKLEQVDGVLRVEITPVQLSGPSSEAESRT